MLSPIAEFKEKSSIYEAALYAALLFSVLLGGIASAREPNIEYYKENIAYFYSRSDTTAHIQIVGYKLARTIHALDPETGKFTGPIGYRAYAIRFRILGTYKGSLKSSSSITMTIEYPGKPPLGEYIVSLNRDKQGHFYFADDSLMMVPAKPELVSFAKSLK